MRMYVDYHHIARLPFTVWFWMFVVFSLHSYAFLRLFSSKLRKQYDKLVPLVTLFGGVLCSEILDLQVHPSKEIQGSMISKNNVKVLKKKLLLIYISNIRFYLMENSISIYDEIMVKIT